MGQWYEFDGIHVLRKGQRGKRVYTYLAFRNGGEGLAPLDDFGMSHNLADTKMLGGTNK